MLVTGVPTGRRAVMGRAGAGERRWFCCSSAAASHRILHPNVASASEALLRGAGKKMLPAF